MAWGSSSGEHFLASNPPLGNIAIAAAPNGTNDTAGLQALHDNLPAAGGWIILQTGTYKVPTGGLTFTKPVRLSGAGAGAGIGTTGGTTGFAAITAPTIIQCSSSTADLIVVQASGCIFEDFALVNSSGVAPTAGTGIKLATLGHYTRFNRILVWGFWNNIEIASGWGWKMLQCDILDPINYGLFDHNLTPNGDAGDPSIDSCLFHAGAYQTATALANLRWESGGGMKVVNSKFNGNSSSNGPQRQVDALVADGVATSDFQLIGNSFENSLNHLVRIGSKGTTGTLGSVLIVGNQFAGQSVQLGANASSQTITGIDVSANVFRGTGLAAQYTDQLRIGPNTWQGSGTIDLSTGTNTNWFLSPKQNFVGDNFLAFRDGSVTNNHAYQNCTLDFDRDIPSTTSSVTYTTLWRLAMAQDSAGMIELTCVGAVGAPANFMLNVKRGYQRAGAAACTVTTMGTDTNLGRTIDFLFDVASVAGEVQVKIRLNAGAGGTDIFGTCNIQIKGVGVTIRKGA